MTQYREFDLSRVRTYSAQQRASKVRTDYEAGALHTGMSMAAFLEALPGVLKADDLKAVARSVVRAREHKKAVIAMIGGHVIKCGCSTVLRDLVHKGFITHVASNGAAAIHDTELARFGHTSEDVTAQLDTGDFGMAADTAQLVNEAARTARDHGLGFGEAVGQSLVQQNPPYVQRALIASCFQQHVPYTLHVALGTDIVHQHPNADGAAIGDASLRDFRIFTASVVNLEQGGVVLNFGSAVIMPEVFLKALAVARNCGHRVRSFTTANFDMIQHYRPHVNVITRPVHQDGTGYAVTGHHELMIPLLAAAIYEYSDA
jgi:hypothetical protein